MGRKYNPNDNFINGVVDQSDLTTFVNLSVSIPKRIIDSMPTGSNNKLTYSHITTSEDSIVGGTPIEKKEGI